MVMPEEWKSSCSLRDSHRAQIGVYFLRIEGQMRVKPPYGDRTTRRRYYLLENRWPMLSLIS